MTYIQGDLHCELLRRCPILYGECSPEHITVLRDILDGYYYWGR